jgi:hypothetical protein
MRETCQSGSEGREAEPNRPSLPLSQPGVAVLRAPRVTRRNNREPRRGFHNARRSILWNASGVRESMDATPGVRCATPGCGV